MPALAVPAHIANDGAAKEVARVWSAGGGQSFILDVRQFQDPAAWGIFAMDLMKHAARAYEHMDGRPKEDAYKRILAGFMAEMENPTEEL